MRVYIENVSPPLDPLPTCTGRKRAKDILAHAEAFSHKDVNFVASEFFEAQEVESMNPLIMAATVAFATHRPMELTPDVVYNVVLQGISAHVATDPEKFRNLLVSHQKGKQSLVVQDDSLVAGSWDNDWGRSVNRLRDMILERVPAGSAAAGGFGLAFSTTTRDMYVAHSAVLMEAVKEYYEYTVMTLCGIPWVDVQGTADDWAGLARGLNKALPVLGLSGWNANLQDILRGISTAYGGKPDMVFWRSMYKYHGASGSGGVARVDGWLAKLFLYTKSGVNTLAVGQADDVAPGPVLAAPVPVRMRPARVPSGERPWADEDFWRALRETGREEPSALWSGMQVHAAAPPEQIAPPAGFRKQRGVPLADFSLGLSKVDFIWDYFQVKIPMVLRAGLVGVSTTGSGVLCPQVGWVIGRK
jgi:hypothetical protein